MVKTKAPAAKEWLKGVFAADNHGDQVAPGAAAALFRFCAHWKPDLRVHGGDNFDFRPIRRKADAHERRESMRKDFEAGVKFLRQFKPNVYLRGNHCQRPWEIAAQGEGPISDYAGELVERIEALMIELNCSMMPYHKTRGVYRVGHLKLLHGMYTGINACRRHALHYGSCAFGHVHTIDQQSAEGYDIRLAQAVGCLCSLDMPYLERCPGSTRHAHGFMPFAFNKRTGLFHAFQAKQIGDTWNFDVLGL
jgi:hypothetical protein